jgi:hypothetical protein
MIRYHPLTVKQVRAWLASVRPQHVIAVAVLLLLIFDTFVKSLSAVALGLIVVALSPWLIKFMKTLELPGGIKMEFRDQLERVTERAKEAGLLDEAGPPAEKRTAYEAIYNDDPTLALASLRIELERRIRELGKLSGFEQRRGPVLQNVRLLRNEGVLQAGEAGAIEDLMPLLNKAVHSEEFSREAAGWAMQVGPRILAGLDRKIEEGPIRNPGT